MVEVLVGELEVEAVPAQRPLTYYGFGLTLPKTKFRTRKIVTASEIEVRISGHRLLCINL
jgi:hypothetical protein